MTSLTLRPTGQQHTNRQRPHSRFLRSLPYARSMDVIFHMLQESSTPRTLSTPCCAVQLSQERCKGMKLITIRPCGSPGKNDPARMLRRTLPNWVLRVIQKCSEGHSCPGGRGWGLPGETRKLAKLFLKPSSRILLLRVEDCTRR